MDKYVTLKSGLTTIFKTEIGKRRYEDHPDNSDTDRFEPKLTRIIIRIVNLAAIFTLFLIFNPTSQGGGIFFVAAVAPFALTARFPEHPVSTYMGRLMTFFGSAFLVIYLWPNSDATQFGTIAFFYIFFGMVMVFPQIPYAAAVALSKKVFRGDSKIKSWIAHRRRFVESNKTGIILGGLSAGIILFTSLLVESGGINNLGAVFDIATGQSSAHSSPSQQAGFWLIMCVLAGTSLLLGWFAVAIGAGFLPYRRVYVGYIYLIGSAVTLCLLSAGLSHWAYDDTLTDKAFWEHLLSLRGLLAGASGAIGGWVYHRFIIHANEEWINVSNNSGT